jgi:hypothetical protein
MNRLLIVSSLAAVTFLAGCGAISQPVAVVPEVPIGADQSVTETSDEGITSFRGQGLASELAGFPLDELSEAEVEGLLFMREEEKLARDVYAALYEKWGQNSFNNIGQSEQTHTDAVRALLERYGLSDPAAETAVGVFQNEELQALHDSLVARGSGSLEEALRVGAAIEEIDILDIQEYLLAVDNDDIAMVYENLMRGSRNHLRAFVRNLDRQGVAYEPEYLDLAAYDEIIAGETERGDSGYGQGGQGQGGNGRGGGQGRMR